MVYLVTVTSQAKQYHIVQRLVHDELEQMWNEAIIAQLEVLSWHLHGGTDENQWNFGNNSKCPKRDSNLAPYKY